MVPIVTPEELFWGLLFKVMIKGTFSGFSHW